MARIYPRAGAAQVAPTMHEADVAAAMVLSRESGDTEKAARLAVLSAGGGDANAADVTLVNRVADEIEADRKAWEAVSPADHASATKYKAALSACGRWLDATTWYNGVKARHGVSTWNDLVSAVSPSAVEL
ncbi:hypothetical protein LCGC14_1831760 [marine sediment metagenome]|uniref:Uncharacterized protein n=1 Tax=marine sediment metagenome TaxID=412755 RepID=A0A0F9GFT4_9ZZZZ